MVAIKTDYKSNFYVYHVMGPSKLSTYNPSILGTLMLWWYTMSWNPIVGSVCYEVFKRGLATKGQLISKGLFAVFIWTKKRTKYFCPEDITSRAEIFRSFFGSNENNKKSFRNWLTFRNCTSLFRYLLKLSVRITINKHLRSGIQLICQ